MVDIKWTTPEEHQAYWENQLFCIDVKKVRAITEAILTGDTTRLRALEAEAQELRNNKP